MSCEAVKTLLFIDIGSLAQGRAMYNHEVQTTVTLGCYSEAMLETLSWKTSPKSRYECH